MKKHEYILYRQEGLRVTEMVELLKANSIEIKSSAIQDEENGSFLIFCNRLDVKMFKNTGW